MSPIKLAPACSKPPPDEKYTYHPLLKMTSPCAKKIAELTTTECTAPPECVIDANNATYSPNTVPQYSCQLMHSGGWVHSQGPGYGPTGSFCANKYATGDNLAPGNWNQCVKYGDGWHITAPSPNNHHKCYDNTTEMSTLCLGDNPCPLYQQAEAEAKCLRYPTRQACERTLLVKHGWNKCMSPNAPNSCKDDVQKKIKISDSGKESLNVDRSQSHLMFDIILVIVFIGFCVLGYYLLTDVEKYRKGKAITSNVKSINKN